MTRDDAVRAATLRCITAASVLAAGRALEDMRADDRDIASILAAGVVSGWADDTTFGTADARGVTVSPRTRGRSFHIGWSELAVIVRRGIAKVGTDRLDRVSARYMIATTTAGAAQRLRQRAATVELAQVRAEILDAGLVRTPMQQPLFELPPTNARGRP